MKHEPKWVSAKGATQLFELSRQTLLKLAKAGKIRSTKLGPSKQSPRRYEVDSIQRYVEVGPGK